jgi:hypothetical protein
MLIWPAPPRPTRCTCLGRASRSAPRLDLGLGIVTDCAQFEKLAPLLVQLISAICRPSWPDDAPIRLGRSRATISITRVSREQMIAIFLSPATEPPAPQPAPRPLAPQMVAAYDLPGHLVDLHLTVVSQTVTADDLGALAERISLAVVHHALLPDHGPRPANIRATLGLCPVSRARMDRRRDAPAPPPATRGAPARRPLRRRTPLPDASFVEALWLDPWDSTSALELVDALSARLPPALARRSGHDV